MHPLGRMADTLLPAEPGAGLRGQGAAALRGSGDVTATASSLRTPSVAGAGSLQVPGMEADAGGWRLSMPGALAARAAAAARSAEGRRRATTAFRKAKTDAPASGKAVPEALSERLAVLEDKCDMQLELLSECLRSIRRLHGGAPAKQRRPPGLLPGFAQFRQASYGSGDESEVAEEQKEQEQHYAELARVLAAQRGSSSEPEALRAATVRVEGTQHAEDSEGRAQNDVRGHTDGRGARSMITRATVMMEGGRRHLRKTIWQFLEDSDSSHAARVYSHFVTFAIMCCIFTSWTSVIWKTKRWRFAGADFAQKCLEMFFLLDIVARFVVCPSRRVFFFSLYNLIDCFVAIQIALRLYLLSRPSDDQGAVASSIMVFVPTIMMLKLLRRFTRFQLLLSAFSATLEALPVLLFTLLLITLFFSGVVYLLEARENISTMSEAMWMILVTMSTVGYGDVTPKTPGGKLAVAVLTVVAALYIAMPISIVGSAFSQVWDDRERLLVLRQMRDRIVRSGCTPDELHAMLLSYDRLGSGQVSIVTFMMLMRSLQVEVSDKMCQKVLDSFDIEGNGRVDFEMFLAGAFPGHSFLALSGPASLFHLLRDNMPAWHSEQRRRTLAGPEEEAIELTRTMLHSASKKQNPAFEV